MMEREYLLGIANIIWHQIKNSLDWSVYGSWGITKKYYTEYEGMPALILQVNGFKYKGKVIIALNEGKDLYEIYLRRKGVWMMECDEIYNDQLGEVLDRIIETDNDKSDEYSERVNKWVEKIMKSEAS